MLNDQCSIRQFFEPVTVDDPKGTRTSPDKPEYQWSGSPKYQPPRRRGACPPASLENPPAEGAGLGSRSSKGACLARPAPSAEPWMGWVSATRGDKPPAYGSDWRLF